MEKAPALRGAVTGRVGVQGPTNGMDPAAQSPSLSAAMTVKGQLLSNIDHQEGQHRAGAPPNGSRILNAVDQLANTTLPGWRTSMSTIWPWAFMALMICFHREAGMPEDRLERARSASKTCQNLTLRATLGAGQRQVLAGFRAFAQRRRKCQVLTSPQAAAAPAAAEQPMASRRDGGADLAACIAPGRLMNASGARIDGGQPEHRVVYDNWHHAL